MLLGKISIYLSIEFLGVYHRHGHHRIVELLLRSKRFSVNAVDNSHMSPLHLAALGGRAEVIRILLDCPDINVV
jgi:ankyrin repeat protein